MASIVVYVEQAGGSPKASGLEALGAAHATGANVVAVVAGSGCEQAAGALGAHGASKVVTLQSDTYSPDALARDVAAVVRAESARALLASATSTGRDVLPRAAALLDSNVYTDCTSFEADGDGYRFVRPWLAGKLVATLKTKAPVTCATLRRNNFAPVETNKSAEVIPGKASTDFKAVLKEIVAKEGGKLDVAEAPVVVSGGRGLKGPENFHLLEELAAAFGNAAVGASRAVVDAGWRPHAEQVGQTGKTISPQLYIAAGISGAIQHLAGMKTSKVIVAINKDADAPIFKLADYGIVGDALEVLPALTKAVKEVRARG